MVIHFILPITLVSAIGGITYNLYDAEREVVMPRGAVNQLSTTSERERQLKFSLMEESTNLQEHLDGMYSTSIEYKGNEYGLNYHFSNQHLQATLTSEDGHSLEGEAEFEVVGSVVLFSSKSGNASFFPDAGEAYSLLPSGDLLRIDHDLIFVLTREQ